MVNWQSGLMRRSLKPLRLIASQGSNPWFTVWLLKLKLNKLAGWQSGLLRRSLKPLKAWKPSQGSNPWPAAYIYGELSEWFMEAVSKTVDGGDFVPGFESLIHRCRAKNLLAWRFSFSINFFTWASV